MKCQILFSEKMSTYHQFVFYIYCKTIYFLVCADLPGQKPALSNVDKMFCSRTQHLVLAGVEPTNLRTHDLESNASPLHHSAPLLSPAELAKKLVKVKFVFAASIFCT